MSVCNTATTFADSAVFDVKNVEIEIDNNLYNIIIEMVRNGRKYMDKDDLFQGILNEYEDRFLRTNRCQACSRLIERPQNQPEALFKPTIAVERRYTSRQVYTELAFLYDTNRYHIKKLIQSPCDCCSCKHDIPGSCPCCVPPCGMCNMNVDDYIRNLIKTNYDQAAFGLNKTSILMSLPSYINRQEFETKIRTICDVDATTYKLKVDLEIV